MCNGQRVSWAWAWYTILLWIKESLQICPDCPTKQHRYKRHGVAWHILEGSTIYLLPSHVTDHVRIGSITTRAYIFRLIAIGLGFHFRVFLSRTSSHMFCRLPPVVSASPVSTVPHLPKLYADYVFILSFSYSSLPLARSPTPTSPSHTFFPLPLPLSPRITAYCGTSFPVPHHYQHFPSRRSEGGDTGGRTTRLLMSPNCTTKQIAYQYTVLSSVASWLIYRVWRNQ